MTNNSTSYWFFIRGLMRESAHWEDFPQVFERAFPNSKVITLDLPGSGVNWSTESPITVSGMVDSLRNQAQLHLDEAEAKFGKRPESFVLAISLGGMVALEWLQKFSEDFKRGVFINISLAGVNPFYKRLKPKAWAPLLEIVLTKDTKKREMKVLDLTASQGKTPDSRLQNRVLAFEKHPARKMNFLRQLIAASRFRPSPKKISSPILLLNSLGDRLVDSSCSIAISRKFNWQLKTHPTANHDLPLEDPEWIIDQIQNWIEET